MLTNMSTRAYAAFIMGVFTITFLVTCFLMAGAASAHVVEEADRTVDRVVLTYAEPVPTKRHPHRVYYELNDGSAYRHMNARLCLRSNEVPNRICGDVFWYAR